MQYAELVILLPCHSFEDFPSHHEGEDADGLLAAWTALWHPRLLAAAGKMPKFRRADDPAGDVKDRLILVPQVSMSQLPTGFAQRVKSEGGVIIRKKADRAEIVAEALAALDPPAAGAPPLDDELVADFFALGFCFLQVQMLTRQMHYSSRIDEIYFGTQTIAAAEAAVNGDAAKAREALASCFNVLSEEREQYYGVDVHVLDLTLVAPTTIGAALRAELARPEPLNLLLHGVTVEAIAAREPETLALLKKAIAEERVGLVGGELAESRWPLMSQESIVEDLKAGIAVFEKHLGKRPSVFGRRRYGLSPALPSILERLGFQGAIHATLDDGRFPEGSQTKTRWEGWDTVPLDAIARAPRDAAKPATFLSYAQKLSEAISSDHVATIVLAHWPGQTSVWYEDLRRAARHTGALGKFTTVERYFANTDHAPYSDRFEPDQYRSPYLKQAVIRRQPDPLSSSMRYWRRRAMLDAAHHLRALSGLLASEVGALPPEYAAAVNALHELEQSPDGDPAPPAAHPDVSPAKLEETLAAAAQRAAAAIAPGKGDANAGLLVLNPSSYARRIEIADAPLSQLPKLGKPIYAAGELGGRRQVVVDVPPLGFTWVPPSGFSPPNSPTLVEGTVLRNEYLEAIINPHTGGLQSLHDYKSRGNRLSQQLALRLPADVGGALKPGEADGAYSIMAVDRDGIQTTSNTPALGEITVRGRLLDREGKPVATFVEIFRLWRGSRVLGLEVELAPLEEPRADPWNSYYACRFAFPNEASDLYRNVHFACHPAKGKRLEAPLYLEMSEGETKTTIFPGGLPYHRRIGRLVETLLIVRGETCRNFSLAIGVDVPYPLQTALGLLTPPAFATRPAAPQGNASSWLFHVDARNVMATHWSALVEEGRVVGFRVRLAETTGRSAQTKVSSFRPIVSARQVDFQGLARNDCEVVDGAARIALLPHEWAEMECRW